MEFGHQARRPPGLGEPEPTGRVVRLVDHDPVQFLEGLDPTLYLSGLAGLVSEPLDEPLRLGHLTVLLGGQRPLGGQLFLSGHHELGESAHVLGDPFAG